MTQNQALAILKTGANVFLTGEPGSGKTYTINCYINYLKSRGIGVAVTASTGIAATHLGGMTIHSWSGIGIKKELNERDLAKLRRKQKLVSRAKKTKVLIIDEVSMLSAEVLNCVDKAVGTLRENPEPFGGMQVVLVGDFFQLPPVVREEESFSGFAFESSSWEDALLITCYLTEQHRQQDLEFLSVLSSIRNRTIDTNTHKILESRKIEVEIEKSITRLYSHNIDVDRINNERLSRLHEKEYVYKMKSDGPENLVEQLKKTCLSPEILILKKGAKVMFTKNDFVAGFVNGTTGEVCGFEDGTPVVKTQEGREIGVFPMEWEVCDGENVLASVTQLPLKLAWAITVHKSQGMTLDSAVMDLSDSFEYGQGYVAISRVKSLSGLFLSGFNKRALEVHPGISETDISFRMKSDKAKNRLRQYPELDLKKKWDNFVGKSVSVDEKSTYSQTLEMYNAGKSISKIAKLRSLKEGTILNHLEKLKERGELVVSDFERLIPQNLKKDLPQILNEFNKSEKPNLSPVYEKFNGKYSYDDLRLARLLLN